MIIRYGTLGAAVTVCMLAIGAASMPAAAINCTEQFTQTRPIDLGVSGGNINGFFNHNTECASGTLGSLVMNANGTKFILSNNHVLADINKATKGQLIVQPGLADINCQKIRSDAVATFSTFVPLLFGGPQNTVDAAIAKVIPGDVNADILNIGPVASTVVAPSLGLPVEKMGDASCFTTGMISAVGAHGMVSYGGGKKAKFVNQIVIDGNFSSAGDSGSLIVTQDACPQAVGLLFAGSVLPAQTIANPISVVLRKLKVSMVGGCTAAMAAPQAVAESANSAMSKEAMDSATGVRDRHEDELMNIPGAVGTAIGIGDQPGQPAIVVYLKKMTPEAQYAAPKTVEGVPVKLIENGGFVAY